MGIGWGGNSAQYLRSSVVERRMSLASSLCNLKTSLSTTREESVGDACKKKSERTLGGNRSQTNNVLHNSKSLGAT